MGRHLVDGIGNPCAPPRHGGCLGESSFEYLVPANHLAAFFIQVVLHLMDEPCLQLELVFQSLLADASLAVGTALPVVLAHLVAADMHILVGEEGDDLVPDVATEVEHLILSRAERRGEPFAPPHFLEARQAVVVLDGAEEMAGHVYLRHNLDASLASISHDCTNIVLRIIAAIER